jgi:hypothetical protein
MVCLVLGNNKEKIDQKVEVQGKSKEQILGCVGVAHGGFITNRQ